VLRYLFAAAAAISCILPLHGAEQQPAPAPAPGALSIIYSAQDPRSLDQLEENPAVIRRMVDALVIAATQQPDIARAWRSLIAPNDRVGIKVAAAGGRYFASHRGIVEAIVSGLELSGVPRTQMIVWDRDLDELHSAGFVPQRGGYEVRGIPPGIGYDREAKITAPTLGKLIWGDALFQGRQKRFGAPDESSEQLSSASQIARVVSREITKIINVPVLSDESGCGVAGALYNMTIPNVDNWRRFTQSEGGGEAIPDVYADEHLGPKVVLHIMDALHPQYAGGPRFNPNYAFAWHTIYASRDPVALDAHAMRLIDGWRSEAKLPPLGKRATWIASAADSGLGNFAAEKIVLRPVELR
jgi:hypothetical protein